MTENIAYCKDDLSCPFIIPIKISFLVAAQAITSPWGGGSKEGNPGQLGLVSSRPVISACLLDPIEGQVGTKYYVGVWMNRVPMKVRNKIPWFFHDCTLNFHDHSK